MEFASANEVRVFFSSLGFDAGKLAELDTICGSLEPGKAFHQKMFLPRAFNITMRSAQAAA
jgi:hypothetical protein